MNKLPALAAVGVFSLLGVTGCSTPSSFDGYVHAQCAPTTTDASGNKVTSCSATEKPVPTAAPAVTVTAPAPPPVTVTAPPVTVTAPAPPPVTVTAPAPAPSSAPAPAPTPSSAPAPVPAGETGQVITTAYVTGYGWPDNTPPGGDISNPVLHQTAGGLGTYADPVTIAVGHSLATGRDVLDYPKGTKFYIPNLQKYFIVEDTCGDGPTPQNGPCHVLTSADPGSTTWVDVWVGGKTRASAETLHCEDFLTGKHTIIVNPSDPGYKVLQGDIIDLGGWCHAGFGETPTK